MDDDGGHDAPNVLRGKLQVFKQFLCKQRAGTVVAVAASHISYIMEESGHGGEFHLALRPFQCGQYPLRTL